MTSIRQSSSVLLLAILTTAASHAQQVSRRTGRHNARNVEMEESGHLSFPPELRVRVVTNAGALIIYDAEGADLVEPGASGKSRVDASVGGMAKRQRRHAESPKHDSAQEPPTESPTPMLVYWADYADGHLYVFGRTLEDPIDAGHALWNLQRDLAIDASAVAMRDRLLLRLLEQASVTPEDATTWHVASEPLVAWIVQSARGNADAVTAGPGGPGMPNPDFPDPDCSPDPLIVLDPVTILDAPPASWGMDDAFAFVASSSGCGGGGCCSESCCGDGLFCCGEECCVSSARKCCGDHCCPKAGVCCEDGCCGAGLTCCEPSCCDPATQQCCEDHCCPSDGACCGAWCCGAGQECADPDTFWCCDVGARRCDTPNPTCCDAGGSCCPNPAGSAIPNHCCGPNMDCCGNGCCLPGSTCRNDDTNLCCPTGVDDCGTRCCPDGQTCRDPALNCAVTRA